MDFRLRILGITALLSVLIGLFIGGLIFSHDRMQARAAARPLLSLASPAEIASMEIVAPGSEALRLERKSGGWEAVSGGRALPASADRAEALARLVARLPRGTLVSRDPAAAGLGLADGEARLLVVHRTAGHGDVALFVGARAPSGEEDYVKVRGENAAYLTRGNLSVLLSQDRPYWYDLSLLPAGLDGPDILRIRVAGSLVLGEAGAVHGGYALVRFDSPAGGWSLQGEAWRVDSLAADAMASGLARLEAEDYGRGGGSSRSPALTVELTTREGKTYSLAARPGASPLVEVTTSWSPWAYLVSPTQLKRAVFNVSQLLAGPQG